MERRHNTRHAAALAAAKDAEVRTSDGEDPELKRTSPGRSDMYEAFQTWALKTYGDSAKTKTVTRRKYNRITKILKGEEQTSAENSKFRFWVKAKGFRIGPSQEDSKKDTHLYVPCSRIAPGGNGKEETVFKKVAVVENFFDIIYGVHVEMDGRGGKHAGQKRTYKAIAETYAFLPREAVTHFLMSCADCQKRMHLAGGDGVKGRHGNEDEEEVLADPPEIDYSLPITTTYLKHMRRLGYSEEYALNPDKEESSSNPDSEVSEGGATSQEGTCHSAECQTDDVGDDFVGPYDVDCGGRTTDCEGPLDMSGVQQENGQWSGDTEPINMSREDKSATGSHQDHAYDRIMSPFSGATSREAPATPDNLSAGTKDDDDDDDDDDADKIDSNQCDPERLKAFNMAASVTMQTSLSMEQRAVCSIIPHLSFSSHKGQAGRIGVIGGSKEYTGAPYFAAISALKVGCDLAHVFCSSEASPVIKSYSPELIVHPVLDSPSAVEDINSVLPRLHSLVIGPGLGRSGVVFKTVKSVLAKAQELQLPLVLDADALFFINNNLDAIRGYEKAILTPNIAEFARLRAAVFGQSEPTNGNEFSTVDVAELSKEMGHVTVVLKGNPDVISNGRELVTCTEKGSPRRCGGQGDLLSGSMAVFNHWGNSTSRPSPTGVFSTPIVAALGACMLTRRCSRMAFQNYARSMTTSDMIREIRLAFASLFPVD